MIGFVVAAVLSACTLPPCLVLLEGKKEEKPWTAFRVD
jgi:hypothetical protein